jgi:hypothetical protein
MKPCGCAIATVIRTNSLALWRVILDGEHKMFDFRCFQRSIERNLWVMLTQSLIAGWGVG